MGSFYEKRNIDYYYRDATDGSSHLRCADHMHYHIELVYMLEGHSTAIVESNPYEIVSDSATLIFPNVLHAYQGGDSESYRIAIFTPELVPELQSLFAKYTPKNPVFAGVSEHPEMKYAFEALAIESAKPLGQNRNTAIRGLLLFILSNLLSLMPLEEKNRRVDSETLRGVVDYCAENYTRELTLEILGEELHMNKYYISHLFSKKFNMCFSDYINSLRVSEACRLLKMTTKSMTEISDLVGFGTTRTFNRAFRKLTGFSPSSYRKNDIDVGAQFTSRILFRKDPKTEGNQT